MHVIEAQNVRDALPLAVDYILQHGQREQTRQGEAMAAPGPVTIRYRRPKEHVLLNKVRDANPFFHLMEAMWMLAGRQDGQFLDHYIKGFSKHFGNEYGIIPDAYGYRWKYGLKFNQLDEIVAQFKKDPNTRQCVLQMWGAGAMHDLRSEWPRACNLIATFRIIDGKLSMCVFNRSNDLIWGCCGANAVHFPMMQEYVAGKLELGLGSYWQITTNLHLYESHIQLMLNKLANGSLVDALMDRAYYEQTKPLITFPKVFDQELQETMGWIDDIHQNKEVYFGNISNRFLSETVLPMAMAHQSYQNGSTNEAYGFIQHVAADDWRTAGIQWLDRRYHGRTQRTTTH